MVLAGQGWLILCYIGANPGEDLVAVKFDSPRAHDLGGPNDEALHGHPLFERGLDAYGIYEVLGSSWIRAMERMNSVHPRHRPERFASLRHFIFTFHDVTFECVAAGVRQTLTFRRGEGDIDKVLERLGGR